MSLVKMSQNEVRPYLDDLQKKVEARWEATVEGTGSPHGRPCLSYARQHPLARRT